LLAVVNMSSPPPLDVLKISGSGGLTLDALEVVFDMLNVEEEGGGKAKDDRDAEGGGIVAGAGVLISFVGVDAKIDNGSSSNTC
jgi:hypothetical protein